MFQPPLLILCSQKKHPTQLGRLRCVQNLEAAVETLEQQYEKCELVKLDVSELHTEKDLEPATVKEFPGLRS